MKIPDRFKRISFRLSFIFVASILLVIILILSAVSHYVYEEAYVNAQSTMEVGPACINDATNENTVVPLSVYDDIDIDDVIFEFTPIKDLSARGEYDDSGRLARYIITNLSEIGLVTLYASDLPVTISTKPYSAGSRRLFYKEVDGYANILLIASIDTSSYLDIISSNEYNSLLFLFSPLIAALAVFFGWLVSKVAIIPIKKIAQTTEKIGVHDLSQRVPVNSSDEIGSLARSFNLMADRLEDSFNSQKHFISDASHELKTPLASMKTSVTHALSSEKSPKEYQKTLGLVNKRIESMETLINDLLFLARADERGIKASDEAVDISLVITELREIFNPFFEDRDIEFDTRLEEGLFVKVKRNLLIRLLTNLLDNAAKSINRSGSISITTKSEARNAVITISDTGEGIPPEHVEKIFERFYKMPGSRTAAGGSGLGLSICKKIVIEAGGDISLKSALGKGSIFTVKLPRAGRK